MGRPSPDSGAAPSICPTALPCSYCYPRTGPKRTPLALFSISVWNMLTQWRSWIWPQLPGVSHLCLVLSGTTQGLSTPGIRLYHQANAGVNEQRSRSPEIKALHPLSPCPHTTMTLCPWPQITLIPCLCPWPGSSASVLSWSGSSAHTLSWPGSSVPVLSWPGSSAPVLSWPGPSASVPSWPGSSAPVLSWPGSSALSSADPVPLPLPSADLDPLPITSADLDHLPLSSADLDPLPLPSAALDPLSLPWTDLDPLPTHSADLAPLLPLPWLLLRPCRYFVLIRAIYHTFIGSFSSTSQSQLGCAISNWLFVAFF